MKYLLGIILSLMICSSAQAHDVACGPLHARTVVLVAHAGGWFIGNADSSLPACEAFAAAGARAISLDYPLDNLPAAFAYVRAAAIHERRLCRHCRIFAYGESAGGGMVTWLAAHHLVDRAYAWAPVSDLVAWNRQLPGRFAAWPDHSYNTLFRLSAERYAGHGSAPLRVVHGRQDPIVPVAQSERLKRHWPHMQLRTYTGGHCDDANSSWIHEDAVHFLLGAKR